MLVVRLSTHAVPKAVLDSQYKYSPPYKFAVTHRLLRKDGFNHVVRAKSLSGKGFKVFFVLNQGSNARLGIIVGKKTVPGATDRNRIKRIIRDTFRRHDVKQRNLDIVVMVTRAAPEENSAQAENLKMLFNRVESRCAES